MFAAPAAVVVVDVSAWIRKLNLLAQFCGCADFKDSAENEWKKIYICIYIYINYGFLKIY